MSNANYKGHPRSIQCYGATGNVTLTCEALPSVGSIDSGQNLLEKDDNRTVSTEKGGSRNPCKHTDELQV